MLGLTESQLFQEIDRGTFGIGHLAVNINDQKALEPNDLLRKLASGVANAIEANNKAIANQLHSAGVKV